MISYVCLNSRIYRWFAACLMFFSALSFPMFAVESAVKESRALTFERDVRPIFKAMCFHCHGEDDIKKGDLDVRLVRLLKQGGESGEVISPGAPDKSLLWDRIRTDEMPDGEKKLTQKEKNIIFQWIQQGAQTARPEPENVEDARYTFEELNHWSFKPVSRPNIPRSNHSASEHPIDAFIQEKLEQKGVGFSVEADKRTLIRRLSYDLRGLPPLPSEIDAFLGDESAEAWGKLVDQYLASAQFGERWARYWLDAAGYAESDGGTLNDPVRPYAWRFRDYVVQSFNQNKPIDEFFMEQLAGDELIDGEIDIFNPRHEELLAATGFLQMAPDATRTSNTLMDRNSAVAESLKVVSSAMLGLTVGCAQCHDHKYDPIGIDDYYRFRAFFDPAFPLEKWRTHDARLVDLTQPDVMEEIDRIEAEAKKLEDDIKARREQVALEIQEKKLADVPEEFRELLRDAVRHPQKERSDQQKELLDVYPMVKPTSTIIGLLVEYDAPSYRKFEKEFEKVAAIRAAKPARKMILATTEQPGQIPVSKVFFRGNPESPDKTVHPGELTALRMNGLEANFTADDPDLKTTGRRLAFARHITSGEHPLTARVFVNRVWMHLLGRGIVTTPGDFGISGELPSHPELLDWLARDFMEHGWDQKRLIRQILISRTYRQTSVHRPELHHIDPENSLFGRANMKRLDAESLRDTLLAVSGLMSTELGGASLPVTENPEGKTVIGVRKIKDGLKAGVDGGQNGMHRRSIYVQMQRNKPLNMLATFDLPIMTPNCEVRRHTTVATQSLWLMNDDQMIEWAQSLATVICRESEDLDCWVRSLYERLFADEPTAVEMELCQSFFHEQAEHFQKDPDETWQKALKEHPDKVQQRALAALGQTLLASNRFLYVE